MLQGISHANVVAYVDVFLNMDQGLLQVCCRCVAGVLQCVAVCCSVLQCVAVCCSVLQCVAVCCSVLQYIDVFLDIEHGLLQVCTIMEFCISLHMIYELSHDIFESSHGA